MPNRTQHESTRSERRAWLLPVAMLVVLAGCQDNLRSTATGAASNVPARPSSSAVPHASFADAGLAGTWLSPSCGARTYPRLLTFGADGRFTAEDRVAPCPPGARCIWSGTVYRSGTYSIEGETIHLQIEEPQQQRPGAPFPERLTLAGGPVEREVGDGGTAIDCAYSKQE